MHPNKPEMGAARSGCSPVARSGCSPAARTALDPSTKNFYGSTACARYPCPPSRLKPDTSGQAGRRRRQQLVPP
uniref:Uncharacterized protein n=1 Tax=Setaria italica TaxID=4555 RepID=K3Z1E5_SETIT